MNMSNSHSQEPDFDNQTDFSHRSSKEPPRGRQRRVSYGRTTRAATSHNGIHRRRNKRFSW